MPPELDEEQVRASVVQWLHDVWDPDSDLASWRALLADSGWGRPSWPISWYGRGLPVRFDWVVADEFRRAGAVGVAPGHGVHLVGPTLLEHGNDSQRKQLLRPLLTGEHVWCQLFSEPDAGSDLPSLATRAHLVDDVWIINGQKSWSSGAAHATFGLLLARTDHPGSERNGITCFALDMRQPGIDVRPIRQMNNHASFNEVFLTDVAVEPADVIGTVNSGWQVARTTLANERRLGSALGSGPPRAEGRVMKEARAEARISLKPYQWYRERSGRPDLALSMARRFGRDRDPLVRQALARLHSLVCCAQWTSERARAARQQGRPTGPEGSVGKLHTSLIARAAADLHALIGGQRAVAGYDRDEFERVIPQILTSVPAVSIAGGTDEIQRNILGERILGLPKDPSDLGDTWKP